MGKKDTRVTDFLKKVAYDQKVKAVLKKHNYLRLTGRAEVELNTHGEPTILKANIIEQDLAAVLETVLKEESFLVR